MALIYSDGRVYQAEPLSQERAGELLGSDENVILIEDEGGNLYLGGSDVSATVVPKMMSEAFNVPAEEDPDADQWASTARLASIDSPVKRREYLEVVRMLAKWHPNVKRALALYEDYVLGTGLELEIGPLDDSDEVTTEDEEFTEDVANQFHRFLRANRRSFRLKEWGKRAYRDGEAFVWLLPKSAWKRPWPPRVVFLRPEEIGGKDENADNADMDYGVVTSPDDVFSVLRYNRRAVTSTTRRTVDEELPDIPADQVIHTKIDCDTDEKRGNSRFLPLIKPARQISSMLETEILGRKMQASMVIQRKVAGGPNQVRGISDGARTGTTNYSSGSVGREKIRPGSIITTSPAVEIEFLTPDMNYSDASGLTRQVLLQLVSATGWPEYMITGDASQGNLSSTLVQEGPVVKMVESEQAFFAEEFEYLFDWFLKHAIEAGYITGFADVDEFHEKYKLLWNFPNPVTRDNLKERQADNLGLMNGSLSLHQAVRNSGLKPAKIFRERKKEADELPAVGNGLAAMNPTQDDKQVSSAGNAQDGSGTNQGGDPVVQHDDKVESEGYVAPDGAKAEAKRGLEWRDEFGRGGTAVGVARARDISGGKSLSKDTIGRMVSFFARHEVDKQAKGFSPGEEGYPSNGRIAWALWGGDAGRSWANKVYDSFEDAE